MGTEKEQNDRLRAALEGAIEEFRRLQSTMCNEDFDITEANIATYNEALEWQSRRQDK